MQPVWRADRPQKGRFREFYQCDADVVGSKSLILEIELLNIYREVFEKLGLQNFELRLNNRKILAGLAQLIGATDKMMDMTIAIDKLDKVGIEGVQLELQKNNFNEEQINKIIEFLSLKGTTEERFEQLKNIFSENEEALKGVKELYFVMKQTEALRPNASLVLDLTLARGLNYYTGIIIEVKATDVQMGSIGGGGRYDDLTGVFGLPNVSGVGISFGLDRIYEVMEELKLFPENLQTGVQILFINFGNEPEMYAFQQVQELRAKNIVAELYPSNDKIKKQMEYAHRKKVPFVVLIGDEEMKTEKFQLKNMQTGEQQALSLDEIVLAISK
jgi:histidyl-tRNA synthetase